MAKQIDDLKASLFSTKDGVAACDAINKLTKQAKKGVNAAKIVLADYVCNGAINHMRVYACSCLASMVTESETEFVALFKKGLSDPDLRFWSISGYMNSMGKGSYKELTKIARNKTIPLDDRAHALKCLATSSKQAFDRDLPSDPGHWKEQDLRLSELIAWAKGGYQDGRGYTEPVRHPALDKPRTALEKIVGCLDQKLAKKRQDHQDLAAPTGWLALAAAEDIQLIKSRWKLPSIYLDFLTRFSPIKVTIESRKFYNHFQIFGAGELIEAQLGYSFNPVEQRPSEDWPSHLIVIANHGGDPFVLDLASSDGKDAPVETAEHGAGDWDFSRVTDSFMAFLEKLAK